MWIISEFKSILPHQVHIIKSCFPSTSFPGFSTTHPYGAREREPGNEVDFRLDNMFVEYCEFLKSHLFFNSFPKRAKNVVSDSPGLIDFAVGLVNSILNLPDGRVFFSGEFKLPKNCNQSCSSNFFGLVHGSYSLPECQAVKLTFFAPCFLLD